jgi:hypothetical protein
MTDDDEKPLPLSKSGIGSPSAAGIHNAKLGLSADNNLQHGHEPLKKALATFEKLGVSAFDIDGPVGHALCEWRATIIADLGGADAVTQMQLTVIETAARTKLLIDSLDAWLLAVDGRIINKKTQTLYSIVVQRGTLVDSLGRAMASLGLERRGKTIANLADYVAGKYPAKDPE